MNVETEKRIVAMYFDNKDFETNAKQTIQTLGELKDNLNLEESVKGFEELNNAGKQLNMTPAKNTIDNLKNSLSGMSGLISKAFTIGTGPLRAIENFYNNVKSYATKIIGFDVANRVTNTLESAFQQLTTAPIEAGWNMYQANIDSTKTIMSGTLQSYKKAMSETSADWTYNEEAHMAYVKQNLQELSNYAQKTVFSLSDMTSNVGKFTNNNIDLETSVTAMEGIANMTAKAGQGAQQASMAMYNFSQALGVGKMTSIDWKSIENANIATTELKDLFIQTAAASGKLQKELVKDANGKEIEKFYLTTKNGAALAKDNWIEITAENFRDTLSNGWLDKDTMLNVMQIYSGAINDLDTLAAMGFDTNDSELMEYLMGIGKSATEAAQQVRTFSKMWDAMTESVQSGWADSMELVFGDMREATEFWSEINKQLSDVLDSGANERNAILNEWRGRVYNEQTAEWEKVAGATDGREDLIQGIYGTIEALRAVGSAISKAWSEVFGNIDGKKLQEITANFRGLVDRFKEWLGDINDTDSRISKIKTGLKGVFSVVKIIVTAVRTFFDFLVSVAKPLIDPLLSLFAGFGDIFNIDNAGNLGDILTTLGNAFSTLWSKITGLGWSGIFSKIGEWITDLWVKVKTAVGQFLDENGLTNVKEFFLRIKGYLEEGYNTVKEWWESEDNGVANFFRGIWNSIVGYFTPDEENGGKLPIVKFFEDAWAGVVDFFEELYNDNPVVQKIKTFFSDLWETVVGLFRSDTGYRYNGSMLEEYTYDSPIVAFFKNTWESIKNFFEKVRSWEIWGTIGGFFTDIWNSIVGVFSVDEATGKAPIVTFFEKTWGEVEKFFQSVQEWGIWEDVKTFFTGIWDTITNLFKTPEGAEGEENTEAPIVTFFKKAWASIEEFFSGLSESPVVKAIDGFFTDIWDKIIGLFTPETGWVYNGSMKEEHTYDAPIVQFFKNTWESIRDFFEEVQGWPIWNAIGEFFSGIWNTIVGLFTGQGDEAKAAQEEITASDSGEGAAEAAVQKVGIFERIFNTLSGFVQTIGEKLQGVDLEPVAKLLESLGTFLTGVMDAVSAILSALGRFLSNGWSGLTGEERTFVIVGGAIAAIISVLNAIMSKLAGDGASLAEQLKDFAVAMLAISLALGVLSMIDATKLGPSVTALVFIMAALSAVLIAISKKTSAKQDPETSTERVLTNLINSLTKVGMLAVAMALLPNIITAFGEAKKMAPELEALDIVEVVGGLVAAIVAISVGFTLINKITGNGGLSIAATAKTAVALVVGITILTAALGLLGAAADGLIGAKITVDAIKKGGEILAAVGEALGGMLGSLIGGLIDPIRKALGIQTDQEKMEEATNLLTSLGDKLEFFTADKSSGIIRILSLINMLSETTKNVPDANAISDFASKLEPLGTGIIKFGAIVAGIYANGEAGRINVADVEEGIMKTIDIMKAFDIPDLSVMVTSGKTKADYFISAIRTLTEEMTDADWESLGKLMNRFVTAFNEAVSVDGQPMADMQSALMTNLSAAIKLGLSETSDEGLGAFDAMPIIDAIVKALGYGESAIATAVHAMVQAGIDAGAQGENGFKYTSDSDWALSMLTGTSENSSDMVNKVMENSGIDDMMSAIYGEGGTAENPAPGSVFGYLNQIKDDMNGFELPNIMDSLSGSFSMTDPTTGEETDITKLITDNISQLQTQLEEAGTSFEITLIPTFDWSNLSSEALMKEIGDRPIDLPLDFNIPDAIRLDLAGITEGLDLGGINARLDAAITGITVMKSAVVGAISAMDNHLDRVSTAIKNIKIYIDKDSLVGSITPDVDSALGGRSTVSDRTGVTSPLPNLYRSTKEVLSTM